MISHKPEPAHGRYWNESSAPTYPFGFGLSYTNFGYSNLRLDRASMAVCERIGVSVDVTNKGRVAGDEVVQLYIHQRHGTSARPVRELKGFQRITLEAGKTRTVSFSLGPNELRYWSDATKGWVQDETGFDLFVGGSSAADLKASFEVRHEKPGVWR